MQARDKTTGEPLSDEVIGGLVSEFIRVGTDTTATTIAFAGEGSIQINVTGFPGSLGPPANFRTWTTEVLTRRTRGVTHSSHVYDRRSWQVLI